MFFTRHEDETGGEALELVGPDEQANARAFPEMQNPGSDPVELVCGNLEQLVARIGLEDVLQRLAGVAGPLEARKLHDLLELAAQVGNIARALAVRHRGEQADKAALADDAALRIETLDTDIVHVDGAMHGGPYARLGHDHRRRLLEEMAHLGRVISRFALSPEDMHLGIAQNPLAGSPDRCEHLLAVLAPEVVFAVAEKREVVLAHPFEKGFGFGDIPLVEAIRCGLQRRDGLMELAQNRPPVLDRQSDIVERSFEPGLERARLPGRAAQIDLDVNPRFAADAGRLALVSMQTHELAARPPLHDEGGMDDEMNVAPRQIEHAGDRIDEEGHVVVDDVDHRKRRAPAIRFAARLVDLDAGLAGGAALGEAPHSQGRAR